jgi:hypothetical protein
MWHSRDLTLLGKVLIIKTFGLSQLIYAMQCCQICDKRYKEIDNIILDFLWNRFNGKRRVERIARRTIVKPISTGGLGLVLSKELDQSIKLSRYTKARLQKHPIAIIQDSILKDLTPFQTVSSKEATTSCASKTLTEHALQWLRIAEDKNEHVTWLHSISSDALPKIATYEGIPRMYLRKLHREGHNTIQKHGLSRKCRS